VPPGFAVGGGFVAVCAVGACPLATAVAGAVGEAAEALGGAGGGACWPEGTATGS
jgi:hypothetical protein